MQSQEQQRPASSGKKKMEPKAPETTQPKTTSFWVGLIFFLNQNDVVLGLLFFFFKSEHPKMTSFWGACFFFKKNDTSKTASF